jgi:23S rRNA (guanosine2251-2'-O)-methyltransferase
MPGLISLGGYVQIVGTGGDGLRLRDQPGLDGKVLLLGSEGKGLSRLLREKCDLLLRIPMHGAVSSLNVAVAGGIILYEAFRQRNRQNLKALFSPGE